jgi:hypothetical protein
MSEAEEAWRLWHLLQNLSDTLWNRYESAFMDFCGEAMERNDNGVPEREELLHNQPPAWRQTRPF